VPSEEAKVKAQFARLFVTSDWSRFKRMGEFYLQRAVFLKKTGVDVPKDLQLLARNSLKRLFIGIGAELLVKAVYLQRGFSINELEPSGQAGAPAFPFTFQQVKPFTQAQDRTVKFDRLIPHLPAVLGSGPIADVEAGLKVAKVFRNKEGHGVLSQKFVRSSYTAIESALSGLYLQAWSRSLTVTFSIGRNEKGVWKLA
jgi:hypothetical protein